MNKKNIISTVILIAVFTAICLSCWLMPSAEFSESERRPLEQMPPLSMETIASGEFMSKFDLYATDQFPMRDTFRTIKALFTRYVFNKSDNNGLFTAEGHISKIEYPVNKQMLDNAKDKLDYIYNTYLKDTDVKAYLSIVPDKNYFLAEKNGYLSIDYDKFISDFVSKMNYMEYIDILPLLELSDYYKTDSHWKQENITDIAQLLAEKMGADAKAEYEINILDNPFKGVYLGQGALPFKPDTIEYLTNDVINNAEVLYYDTGMPKKGEMYNMDNAFGKDPYEMFLSGTSPLITIENKMAQTEKELVVFRDSFGSSLAPLLAQGYSKITVVDIRYMQSNIIGNFIDFTNQDVLFIYSTTILNNSTSMR